jgi:hypothetical protein
LTGMQQSSQGHVHTLFQLMQAEIGVELCRQKEDGKLKPPS